MAQIKILTPQTKDGTTLVYDADNKVVYSESIVEDKARPHFLALNAKLPSHLQHKIENVEVPAPKAKKLDKE